MGLPGIVDRDSLWSGLRGRRSFLVARAETGNPQERSLVLGCGHLGTADRGFVPCVLGHHWYP